MVFLGESETAHYYDTYYNHIVLASSVGLGEACSPKRLHPGDGGGDEV